MAERRTLDDDGLRNHPDEHHRLTDGLYPIYPNPPLDKGWGPTPMDYTGWYVLDVYNPENGRGPGRVVPADVTTYIKLLWERGMGFFPHWRVPRRPDTADLFAVEGVREEILTLGKSIADRAPSPTSARPEPREPVSDEPQSAVEDSER
jgi:hypothetical protein